MEGSLWLQLMATTETFLPREQMEKSGTLTIMPYECGIPKPGEDEATGIGWL